MPARSIRRWETICASLGFSRSVGKKYWESRMKPRIAWRKPRDFRQSSGLLQSEARPLRRQSSGLFEVDRAGHRPALGLLRLALPAEIGQGTLFGAAERLAVVEDALAAVLDRDLADLDGGVEER